MGVSLLAGVLVAYLIGSIPTALIAGQLLGGVDIRTTGSKNAGATNLYRAFGLKPYMAVLFLDMFKGFAATRWLEPYIDGGLSLSPLQVSILCGSAAVIGHIFTVFARFKGGKGVATAAGLMFAIIPAHMLIALAVYFLVVSITHYVSLGSIFASASFPIMFLVERFMLAHSYAVEIYLVTTTLALLIVVAHRSNIKRLMDGEESKTYFFKKVQ